jgi:hypothetical protein
MDCRQERFAPELLTRQFVSLLILHGGWSELPVNDVAPVMDAVNGTRHALRLRDYAPDISLKYRCSGLLRAPRFDRDEDVGDDFGARLGSQVAFAVDADTDGIRLHVAMADD